MMLTSGIGLWCIIVPLVTSLPGGAFGNAVTGEDGVLEPSELAACRETQLAHGWYGMQGISSVISTLRTSGAPHGSRMEVAANCDEGFVSLPSSSMTRSRCQNGSWVPEWPVCERPKIPCPVPDVGYKVIQFINGSEARDVTDFVGASLPDGTWLIARCEDPGKLRLIGESRRECSGGEWSSLEPYCEPVSTLVLFAGAPRVVATNGTVVHSTIPPTAAADKRNLRVKCQFRKGSRLRGSPRISAPHLPGVQAEQTRRWRYGNIIMELIRLDPIDPSDSGHFTCGSSEGGGSHTVEVIIADIACPAPVAPVNGNFQDRDINGTYPWRFGQYPIAKKIYFRCNNGYRLVGASEVTCLVDGWSKPTPECIATMCPELPIPVHSEMIGIYGSGRSTGDERVIRCLPGYMLQGATDNLICLDGGVWSAELPSCELLPERPVVRRPQLCTRGDECPSWMKCVITGSNPEYSYFCACINPFNCRTSGPPVCGTDGNNYTSECHLKALACLLSTGVDVANDDDICIQGLPSLEPDADYGGSEFPGNLTSTNGSFPTPSDQLYPSSEAEVTTLYEDQLSWSFSDGVKFDG